MNTSGEFLVDLERGEICALERFLERSMSAFGESLREASYVVLASALQVMHKTVQSAIEQLNQNTLINEVSVAMQLRAEQADAAASAFKRLTVSELDRMLEDEEASNDASLALWKILDVIGPVDVQL